MDSALAATPTVALLNNAVYFLTQCNKRQDLAELYARKALDELVLAAASPRAGSMEGAITLQKSRASTLDTYGWLLFKQGQNDRAINFLNAAANSAPNGMVYAHLAQAESKAGNSEKAALYWREPGF